MLNRPAIPIVASKNQPGGEPCKAQSCKSQSAKRKSAKRRSDLSAARCWLLLYEEVYKGFWAQT